MRPALVGLILAAACGGSGGGAPQGAQFQLVASGVTPITATIGSGGQVTFSNKDAAPHQITSSCAELHSPSLAMNQTFSATLAGPKTCPFSDALNPSNSAFSGTITVDAPAPGD